MAIPPPRRQDSLAATFGVARSEITPPVGIYSRNWGAAKNDVATSVHRPLTLNVLAISQGDTSLILIEADLGWWRPMSLFERFQSRLLKEFNLPADQLIFALTHTHASAPLMEPDPHLPGSELQEAWLESVYESAVATIRQALSDQFSGILDWHQGTCQLASNRDLPDPESDRFLCGYNPENTADSTLVVGRLTDSQGAMRAVLVNYACHPTTLAWENESLSPDFIGAMRETIEQATGANAFYLHGASGELSPKYQYVGDVNVADGHGRQLGYAALAALYDMSPAGTELAYSGVMESGAPLAVWKHRPFEPATQIDCQRHLLELALKDWPSADDLEQQRAACEDRAVQERLRRKRDIRRVLGDGTTHAVPFSVWRLGDAFLVGSCCEAYSKLQTELRQRFPDRTMICMNLINGTIGYLPPEDKYALDIYQVWQTPFAQGSLERLIEAMDESVQSMRNHPTETSARREP
ncbi:MAG: alkaline ceramidase [Planctomycetaceae bacterium]|nr:alkaline ceramidase [Planctomycetaceae bacterium]